jgi:hypothetical protein
VAVHVPSLVNMAERLAPAGRRNFRNSLSLAPEVRAGFGDLRASGFGGGAFGAGAGLGGRFASAAFIWERVRFLSNWALLRGVLVLGDRGHLGSEQLEVLPEAPEPVLVGGAGVAVHLPLLLQGLLEEPDLGPGALRLGQAVGAVFVALLVAHGLPPGYAVV